MNKFEIQSSKVASSFEDDPTSVENIAEDDCQLCSDATDCYLELEQYNVRLVNIHRN